MENGIYKCYICELFSIVLTHLNKSDTEKAIKILGQLDILVNCAGISPDTKPIVEIESADWQRVIDINLTGDFIEINYAFKGVTKTAAIDATTKGYNIRVELVNHMISVSSCLFRIGRIKICYWV